MTGGGLTGLTGRFDKAGPGGDCDVTRVTQPTTFAKTRSQGMRIDPLDLSFFCWRREGERAYLYFFFLGFFVNFTPHA